MKIIKLYFILFSKLYVKFSKGKEDWFYLPLLIISFIICLNIFIISSYFIEYRPYYIIALLFLLYFVLIIKFSPEKSFGKNYIRNFNLSSKTLFLLSFLLIIDFFGVFIILNKTRENRTSRKNKEMKKRFLKKDYLLEKK